MPDSAFLDTENQFRGMAAGADAGGIKFELFTIKEIPRSERIVGVIEQRYRPLDELWRTPPDALIVTGTEPTQAKLRFEPYWPYLARLLEWAADHVPGRARQRPPVRRHRAHGATREVQRCVRRHGRGPARSTGERTS
jgi:homoserine trans-succinylase